MMMIQDFQCSNNSLILRWKRLIMKITYDDRPANVDLQMILGKVNSCNLDMQDAFAVIVRKNVDIRHVQ